LRPDERVRAYTIAAAPEPPGGTQLNAFHHHLLESPCRSLSGFCSSGIKTDMFIHGVTTAIANSMELPKPPVIWWHSMSCICRRCLEHDLVASLGVPFPAFWQMVPHGDQDAGH